MVKLCDRVDAELENVLKQILRGKVWSVPQGQNWHRDLLDSALTHKIIRQATHKQLKQFLAFRHFFSHGYAFDLDPARIEPLVNSVHSVFSGFKISVRKFVA